MVKMKINLSIPPEPTQMKKKFKEELEKEFRLMQANIKQGTWIASPLWTQYGWGKYLEVVWLFLATFYGSS